MKRIYDWEAWFRLKKFYLEFNRDFRCGMSAMAQQVRNAAAARGLHVTINETTPTAGPRGLWVEVTEGEDAVHGN